MRLFQAVVVITALLTSQLVFAEDVLYSKRHQKRFIDSDGNYNISFYHINDVHSHLDQFRSSGADCIDPTAGCYGGYARVKTILNETRPGHNDSLLLNVGDEFQGTLFYTYYGGEKIAETLNHIGFDGMTLGNHEFDGGDDNLGAFLENLTFPIISANIVSDHPILNKTIKPFHIYEEYDLAVIGLTTSTTPDISSPGNGTTFVDTTIAVQNTIDHIKSTTNITRIAAITHIGYEEDQKLAAAVSGLQLIMGGHSHTLLGDMEDAEGKYPTIVENKDGDEVFIVTAYRWGEYLGYIDVTFNPEGKILAYHGAPIHLTNTTKQDKELQDQVDAWKVPLQEFASKEVGSAAMNLDQKACKTGPCVLGSLVADAMLEYRLNQSSTAKFAVVNGGGVRATIDAGPITRGDVLIAFPFSNAVVEIEMKGEEIWKSIEGSLSKINQYSGKTVTSFAQVSRGINITYNSSNSNNTKLVKLEFGAEPFDNATTYNVITVDFVATGGDNIFQARKEVTPLDTLDEVLIRYVQSHSPLSINSTGRFIDVNGTNNAGQEGSPTETTAGSTPTQTPNIGSLTSGSVSCILIIAALSVFAVGAAQS